MPPHALHPDSLARVRRLRPSASELVEAWVRGEVDREPVLLAVRDLPSGRVGREPGPTFWYGSGAAANQRLFELRLHTAYEGSMDVAIDRSESSLCPGEQAVIAARLADEAKTGAYGTLLEPLPDAAGIVHLLCRDRPELLGRMIHSIVNERSLLVDAKLRLLGVVPWAPGRAGEKDGTYLWVTHFSTVVMTLRGSVDGKKAFPSFAMGADDAEREKLERRAIAAAEKKLGAPLSADGIELPRVHLPKSRDVDFTAVVRAADRATLLRALRDGTLPGEVPESVISSGHGWALYDMMAAGVPLHAARATDASARELLARLRQDLLPAAFDWMCRRAWGDEEAEQRARLGVT